MFTGEPEKNPNLTKLVEEYYKCNPRSVGAEEWKEISVHSVTTHLPTPHIITTMPSHDSSTERLVARAMTRGSYSETTTESPGSSVSSRATKEDYQPLPFSPEHDTTVKTVIANLANVAMTSPPSPKNSDPPAFTQTFPASSPQKKEMSCDPQNQQPHVQTPQPQSSPCHAHKMLRCH